LILLCLQVCLCNLALGFGFRHASMRSLALTGKFLILPLQLMNKALQLHRSSLSEFPQLGSIRGLLAQEGCFVPERFFGRVQRGLFGLQGSTSLRNGFLCIGAGMFHRQRPPLSCQRGHRIWGLRQRTMRLLLLQSLTQLLPPGIGPAGTRRATGSN